MTEKSWHYLFLGIKVVTKSAIVKAKAERVQKYFASSFEKWVIECSEQVATDTLIQIKLEMTAKRQERFSSYKVKFTFFEVDVQIRLIYHDCRNVSFENEFVSYPFKFVQILNYSLRTNGSRLAEDQRSSSELRLMVQSNRTGYSLQN